MDADHTHLTDALNKRRLKLGLRWSEVARKAGMTAGNLARIRKGEIGLTDVAAAGLERALLFVEGSLAAGEPVPAEHEGLPTDPASRATRERIVASSPEKLAEMYLLVEDELGTEEAERFLRRALELRRQG